MESTQLPRSRRAFFRKAGLFAAVAVALYAILGFFVAPPIVRSQVPKQIRTYLGREATLRKVRVNPFALSVTLYGLDVRDLDGSELFGFERLHANAQLAGLFRRAWVLRDLDVARPRVVGRILADGKLAIADILERPTPPGEEPGKMPRLVVEHLAIARGRVGFVDETRAPHFESALDPLNLDLRGLSTLPREEGATDLVAVFENGAELRWNGGLTVEPPRAAGDVRITGLKLPRLLEYAASSTPLRLVRGSANLSFHYSAEAGPDGWHAAVSEGSLDLADLAVTPEGSEEEWISAAAVEGRGLRLAWPESTVDATSIRIVDPKSIVRLDAGGVLNWEKLGEAPVRKEAAQAAPAARAGPAPNPAVLRCERLEIVNGHVALEDLSVEPALRTALESIALTLSNVTNAAGQTITLASSLRIGKAGSLELAGSGVIDPPKAELHAELAGLDLALAQPYIARAAHVRLPSAVAGLKGKLAFDPAAKPQASFEGTASLDALLLTDDANAKLAAWESLRIEDLKAALAPDEIRARRIRVTRPFAKIQISKDGELNLSRIFAGEAVTAEGKALGSAGATGMPPAEAKAPEPAQPPASTSAPFPVKVDVGTITLSEGEVDFADESLVIPFATFVHALEGTVRDLSSGGAAGSRITMEGKVEDYGFAQLEGTLRAFDPFASTDLRLLFRNIEMNRLSPYTAEFAGYKIQGGKLDLDIHYRVVAKKLVGDHRLVANQLVLGEKVEGTAAGLALRLAIALLKDKDGKIDLEVPVEGTIDDPQFAYRKVFWSAVRKILSNVAMAPFRWIGRAFGIGGDDLERVEFEPGRADLLPPEREKLQKIVTGLTEKPELAVEVGGRFDEVRDGAAIRTAKVDASLTARRESAQAAGTELTAEQALEAAYAERFSPETLEALRLKYAPPAGETGAAPPTASGTGTLAGANLPAFYDDIRGQLVTAETVTEDDLHSLAQARAAAIVAALTAEGGLPAERVRETDAATVKKKYAGQERVASDLDLSAGD